MAHHTRDTFAIAKFALQALVSLSVLAFCMSMLASGGGSTEVYLPLVSGIVGYWLPQPSLKRKAADSGANAASTATAPQVIATDDVV